MVQIQELVKYGFDTLQQVSPSPHLDSELLAAYVLKCSRLQLIVNSREEVSLEQKKDFDKVLLKRTRNVPIAYITGEKEFYGYTFNVNPHVLIPRPETELIIQEVLRHIDLRENISLLDLGTGSGCIPISVALECKKKNLPVRCIGVDISEEALVVAKGNATTHAIHDQIIFLQSDWFSHIPNENKFDVITANPPYIPQNDPHVSPELMHEPTQALYSGKDGLDAIREIANSIEEFLNPEGVFIMEIGIGQADEVISILKENCKCKVSFSTKRDLQGVERIVVGSF